jgi:flagellar biosynthesis chaperone FliJ
MFEALGLTDAQKQEMENIKKQLELEFEKPLEELANRSLMVENKIQEEMEKKGFRGINFGLIDAETLKKIQEDMRKNSEDTQFYGKQFASQFKTKMFDVLTNEQWLHLQNLIDNPTGLVKIMQDKEKAWREKKEVWSPGPNSWRPGMPIPEAYRIERNQRGNFPRPKVEN